MKKIIFFVGFLPAYLSAASCADLENRIVRHPNDYNSLYNLGVAAFREGDVKKAYDAFICLTEPAKMKMLSKNESVQLFYNAGNAAFKLEKLEQALHLFQEVLARDPGHENARKKRDFIKKLLEKKEENKQQDDDQQKKNDQDKKDQKQQDEKQQHGDQDQKKGDEQQQQKEQGRDKNGSQNSPQNSEEQKNKEQQNQQQGEKNEQKKNQQAEQSGADQDKDEQKKQNGSANQSGNAGQENGAEKKELSGRQQQLLMLAEQLDKNVQRELVRQQTGMQRRGGDHEW